jgi:hypothetical protein
MTKLRWIGLGMIVPMLSLITYLVLSPKMWPLAIMNAVFTLMAMIGWNLFRGNSVKDAIINTATDIANNVESLTK